MTNVDSTRWNLKYNKGEQFTLEELYEFFKAQRHKDLKMIRDLEACIERESRISAKLAEKLGDDCAPGSCVNDCKKHWYAWAEAHAEKEMDE